MKIQIRPETQGDETAIHAVTKDAFEGKAYASGTEASIIDQLRLDGDLTISLVAEDGGEIVGHVAFSPAWIGNASKMWFGLGPVAVLPHRQQQGIGQLLIEEGLKQLRNHGAAGCVLVGDPSF